MKEWLLNMLGVLGQYLKVLVKGAVKAQLDQVMPIAQNAVKMISQDPSILTSDEKRKAAFDTILKQLGDAQSKVGTSIINLAIELAYQNVKHDQK